MDTLKIKPCIYWALYFLILETGPSRVGTLFLDKTIFQELLGLRTPFCELPSRNTVLYIGFWCFSVNELTHWGRVTHRCVSKLTIISSDNGLSPGRRQAIIWTNAGTMLIGPLGTNFSKSLIGILHFHTRKCIWKCLENGSHLVSASMC